MKTPEELADFFYKDIPEIDSFKQWQNWRYRVALAIKNRDSEIQESTRNICADAVLNMPADEFENWKVSRGDAALIVIKTKPA